jgi:hypothetical protein
MTRDESRELRQSNNRRLMPALLDILLIALIVFGVMLRFSWVNWNQGTSLHPDEYGLTNTLTQLSMPDNSADYFNTRISPISAYHKYDEMALRLPMDPITACAGDNGRSYLYASLLSGPGILDMMSCG